MESSASGWLWGGGALSPLELMGPPWALALCGILSTASWMMGLVFVLIISLLSLCLLLLVPLPKPFRSTFTPAIIGMGALTPQPPNLALLFKEDAKTDCSNCSSCNTAASRSWGYLMRLSGLVRPMHAQHKRGVLGALGAPSGSSGHIPPSELPRLLSPHSVVERFSGWGGEGPVASPRFSHHPSGAAELHRPLQEHETAEASAGGDGSPFWGAHYLPAAETAAAGGIASTSPHGGEVTKSAMAGQCKACRLAALWLQPPASSRQELLMACPSLSKGFTPDSVLLQHRLMQGIILYLQEETRFIRLIEFDRQYWVTSVDGDVVLLHYYRHRTDPKACSSSWGPTDTAAVGEGVGCTDSRFPHGRPHGLCGCRGILFIVGGIGAKAYDLQVQHVVLLAAAKGFCVFFLSCLRGIEAPIANLPTDLTTSADVQAALAFILHLHVHGFEVQQQEKEKEHHRRRHHHQKQQQQQQQQAVLKLHEVDDAFRKMIMEGTEEAFLRSIPNGFIPPVFLLGYSMGSCALLRLLGSLGLQRAIQQLQQQQAAEAPPSGDERKEHGPHSRGSSEPSCNSRTSNCRRSTTNGSSTNGPELSPFCRDLAAAVASEYLPTIEWLRFLKGAVTISNAMCLDSCIGSLDRAAGVTGRLCKKTMLRMYKTKQWMEPSTNYVSKGLDPGLVALSQMTSTLREIDLLTHLSLCLTPASPLACTRVYYALTTCLPHMLLAPVPLLCLHALDDPIVESLAVCRAAATVPKYNPNCTYAVVGKGGHNLFQESFWSLVASAMWQWVRNFRTGTSGSTAASAYPERLYVDESFQARVALEFITGVWRRCS